MVKRLLSQVQDSKRMRGMQNDSEGTCSNGGGGGKWQAQRNWGGIRAVPGSRGPHDEVSDEVGVMGGSGSAGNTLSCVVTLPSTFWAGISLPGSMHVDEQRGERKHE